MNNTNSIPIEYNTPDPTRDADILTGNANAAPAGLRPTVPASLPFPDPTEIAAMTDVASALAWVESRTPNGLMNQRLHTWASWDASDRRNRERIVTSVRLLMGRDLSSAAASGKLQKDISAEHGIGERQLRYYLAAWAAVDGKTLPVEVLDRPIPDIPHAVAYFLTTGTLDGVPVPSRKAQDRHDKKTQPAPPPAPLSPTPKPDRPLNVVSRRSKEVEDAMNGVTDWTARTTPRGMVWATPRLLSVALHYYGTKGSEAMPQTDDERGKIEALVDPVHGDTEVRAALSALAALIAAKVANDA